MTNPIRRRSRVSALAVALLLAFALGALGGCNSGQSPATQATDQQGVQPSSNPVAPPVTIPPELTAALRDLVEGAGSELPGSEAERGHLPALYPSSPPAPLWLDTAGRPGPSAREALSILSSAGAEGLEPGDYQAEDLEHLARAMGSGSTQAEEGARFDVGLSLSMMRYLRHLHRGRVDPKTIGFQVNLPADEHNYAALTRAAALESRVEETIQSLTPPLVQYRLLRGFLPTYRALAGDETLDGFPDEPAGAVKPGDDTPSLTALRRRLVALGDLPVGPTPPSEEFRYEGEMVEAVKRFQNRHGLEADGVLGKSTWAMVKVPLSWRLHQIELAMERMRWLPHLGERAFVAVNIPMFRLWGWDSVPESGAPAFEMGVIVGKALNTRTPVFVEEMEYLIFQPYWNVPRSILSKEILPVLRRDLSYLARQDMEMVDGQGDDATPVAATAENVERLGKGALRLRQRPGPKNALGAVKFMFPNDENVYLHSTPAPALFGRARRDFSHGCVRVEDPVDLAQWVLKDQPQWTRERILAAMKGAPSQRVNLTRPIRVVLYYVTAAVIPKEGAIHFAEDIYDQDARLDRALHSRRP